MMMMMMMMMMMVTLQEVCICAGLTKAALMDHIVPAQVAKSVGQVGVTMFTTCVRTG
jgi:hypothetical protein